MQAEEIAEYFDRYGWRYEQSRPNLYRTGFLGDIGQHEIWVRVTEGWVYFAINPFITRDDDREHGEREFDLLLRTNHDLNLAKLSLDGDGDIALSVELPREGFVYSHFADALTALSHYADEIKPRFEDLVHSDDPGQV